MNCGLESGPGAGEEETRTGEMAQRAECLPCTDPCLLSVAVINTMEGKGLILFAGYTTSPREAKAGIEGSYKDPPVSTFPGLALWVFTAVFSFLKTKQKKNQMNQGRNTGR